MIIYPPSVVKSNILSQNPFDIRSKFFSGERHIYGVTVEELHHNNHIVIRLDNIRYKLFYRLSGEWFGWVLDLDMSKMDRECYFFGDIVDNKVSFNYYIGYGGSAGIIHYTLDYKIVAQWEIGYSVVVNINGEYYYLFVDNKHRIYKKGYQRSVTVTEKNMLSLSSIQTASDHHKSSHYVKDNIVYDFIVDGAVETPVIVVDGKVYTENTSLSINTKPKEEIEKEERLNKIIAALPSDTPEWVKAMISAFAK
jgi:hypothetical protein